MHTLRIPTTAPDAIDQALAILQSGGLVAFPTDTVYGVGALVHSEAGIQRLFEAKVRSANKAIAVLVGDPAQLELLTPGLPPFAELLAAHYWPGALTLVVPRRADLPAGLSPLPTVGVRMPNHPFTLELLRCAGPLATSSANLSGETNTLTADGVWDQLAGRVELLLDGGAVPGGVPSTVVDCTHDSLRILRHGAITEAEIQRMLQG